MGGRKVTEADLALYSGDAMDWFTLEQRLAAFHKVENVLQAARRFGGGRCYFAGTGAVDWDGPTAFTKTATPQATESGQNRWPLDAVLRRISQSQNRDPRLTNFVIRRAG